MSFSGVRNPPIFTLPQPIPMCAANLQPGGGTIFDGRYPHAADGFTGPLYR
jgi:hypothetical protein